MYRPVALDEQARELLRARKYAQALHLADTCSGEGAPWAEAAFAEAAFLLMLGDPHIVPGLKTCTVIGFLLVIRFSIVCRCSDSAYAACTLSAQGLRLCENCMMSSVVCAPPCVSTPLSRTVYCVSECLIVHVQSLSAFLRDSSLVANYY
jgi:hypothetical protein